MPVWRCPVRIAGAAQSMPSWPGPSPAGAAVGSGINGYRSPISALTCCETHLPQCSTSVARPAQEPSAAQPWAAGSAAPYCCGYTRVQSWIRWATGFRSSAYASQPSRSASNGIAPPPANISSTRGRGARPASMSSAVMVAWAGASPAPTRSAVSRTAWASRMWRRASAILSGAPGYLQRSATKLEAVPCPSACQRSLAPAHRRRLRGPPPAAAWPTRGAAWRCGPCGSISRAGLRRDGLDGDVVFDQALVVGRHGTCFWQLR